jgi:hypothetical protein
MQRVASVIFSILLGAIAVGIGMGVFLHKANSDRQRLEQLALEAQSKSQQAQDQSQRAVLEANAKLKAANDEVVRAQATLKAIEEERSLLEKAEFLAEPKPETLKGWSEAISLPLKVSVRIPPKNEIEENSDQALVVSSLGDGGQAAVGQRWLQITAYDTRLESELVGAMASTTPIMFNLRGRLLKGTRGTTASGETYVLRATSLGQDSHLIWIREPSKSTREKYLLQILATLSFK